MTSQHADDDKALSHDRAEVVNADREVDRAEQNLRDNPALCDPQTVDEWAAFSKHLDAKAWVRKARRQRNAAILRMAATRHKDLVERLKDEAGQARDEFNAARALVFDAADLLPQAAAWDGTQVVPKDATPAMIQAALAVDWTGGDGDEEAVAHNVWHAMLAALHPTASNLEQKVREVVLPKPYATDQMYVCAETAIVEQLARADGWRQIETAPKDGSEVLIVGGTYDAGWEQDLLCKSPVIAYWSSNKWIGPNLQANDLWQTHSPTHWMPLPAAPAEVPN